MTLTGQQWAPGNTLAIRRITSLDVSPDGRRLAFTVMQAVMTSEQSGFQSQVYLATPDGSQPIRLTAGEASSRGVARANPCRARASWMASFSCCQ